MVCGVIRIFKIHQMWLRLSVESHCLKLNRIIYLRQFSQSIHIIANCIIYSNGRVKGMKIASRSRLIGVIARVEVYYRHGDASPPV